MALESELGLRQGFTNLQHEAVLSVFYTANRLKKRAAEFFRTQGVTDVQFNAMELLRYQSGDEGGLSQVDLSRMMLVNRANITSLIDRMEKGGLVERGSARDDRRFNIVRLTARGRALHGRVEQAYLDEVQRIMSDMSQNELARLIRLLESVRNRLRKP